MPPLYKNKKSYYFILFALVFFPFPSSMQNFTADDDFVHTKCSFVCQPATEILSFGFGKNNWICPKVFFLCALFRFVFAGNGRRVSLWTLEIPPFSISCEHVVPLFCVLVSSTESKILSKLFPFIQLKPSSSARQTRLYGAWVIYLKHFL